MHFLIPNVLNEYPTIGSEESNLYARLIRLLSNTSLGVEKGKLVGHGLLELLCEALWCLAT